MSGFEQQTGWYALTPTKAEYWHRGQAYNGGCACGPTADFVEVHLIPAGFTVERKSTWYRVTGPGLVDGWTDQLYAALSGNVGRERPSYVRQWKG